MAKRPGVLFGGRDLHITETPADHLHRHAASLDTLLIPVILTEQPLHESESFFRAARTLQEGADYLERQLTGRILCLSLQVIPMAATATWSLSWKELENSHLVLLGREEEGPHFQALLQELKGAYFLPLQEPPALYRNLLRIWQGAV